MKEMGYDLLRILDAIFYLMKNEDLGEGVEFMIYRA
jgi:hypothetical protein